MNGTPKQPGVAFWATVVVVAAFSFAAYLGMYASLVEPILVYGTGSFSEPTEPWVIAAYRGSSDRRFGFAVRYLSRPVPEFFGPANWLDRNFIRPEIWTPSVPGRYCDLSWNAVPVAR
jgi:hypothetical protein